MVGEMAADDGIMGCPGLIQPLRPWISQQCTETAGVLGVILLASGRKTSS